MLRLIRAYFRGEYRNVSQDALLTIIAAVSYLVDPFDLIPDEIPFLGFLDDATVVAFAVARTRESLDDFMIWVTSASRVQCHSGSDFRRLAETIFPERPRTRPAARNRRPTVPQSCGAFCVWGAQAASLQLPAACRQSFRVANVDIKNVSASCRDEQASSLCSP